MTFRKIFSLYLRSTFLFPPSDACISSIDLLKPSRSLWPVPALSVTHLLHISSFFTTKSLVCPRLKHCLPHICLQGVCTRQKPSSGCRWEFRVKNWPLVSGRCKVGLDVWRKVIVLKCGQDASDMNTAIATGFCLLYNGSWTTSFCVCLQQPFTNNIHISAQHWWRVLLCLLLFFKAWNLIIGIMVVKPALFSRHTLKKF